MVSDSNKTYYAKINTVTKDEVTFEIYLDMPKYDVITCRLYAVYGEEKYHIVEDI